MTNLKSGEIVRYKNKLCEIIGYVTDNTVVFLRPLKDEDKNKCPHCDKPIPTEFDIVEGCLNWKEQVKPVDTIIN